MKDINAHVESIVKAQLAKACRSRGIDESETGYAVGGHGQVMAMPTTDGQLGFGAAWVVLISLRSKLISKPAIGVSVAVPGALPSDEDFRTIVDLLVTRADNERGAEFFQRPVPEML